MDLHTLFANPIVRGALSGALAAAHVDFLAFRKLQSFYDFTHYSWSVAGFRWFQGAVMGAIMAAGMGSLL